VPFSKQNYRWEVLLCKGGSGSFELWKRDIKAVLGIERGYTLVQTSTGCPTSPVPATRRQKLSEYKPPLTEVERDGRI
jgi:hypothetical protein